MRNSSKNTIIFRLRTDDSGKEPYSQTEFMDKLADGTVNISRTSAGDICICDSLKNDKIMAVCETKPHQEKFYAHKIGEHIYITSRRQIVEGEYFMRMNKIYRHTESFGRTNSNPIIASTDFYFGYTDIVNGNGKTTANQIGVDNGGLVNAPMLPNVPRAFRDLYEKEEGIYEVNVEFSPTMINKDVKRDGITLKTVTPV